MTNGQIIKRKSSGPITRAGSSLAAAKLLRSGIGAVWRNKKVLGNALSKWRKGTQKSVLKKRSAQRGTKPAVNRVMPRMQEMEYSSWRTILKPSKMVKEIKVEAMNTTLKNTYVACMSNAVGVQNAFDFGSGGSGYAGFQGTIVATLYQQAHTHKVTFNSVTATLTDALGTTGYTNEKLFLDGCNNRLRMINEQASVVEVDIYDLIRKTTTIANSNALTDWDAGLTDIGAGTAATHNTYGVNPTQSKEFNVNWRIVKKTKLNLAPGKQHIHNWNFKARRVIDMTYFQKYAAVKGLTHTILIVARGSLSSNVLGPGGSSKVDYCPIKIDCSLEQTFVARACTFYPRNLVIVSSASHDAVSYVVDPISGDVVEVQAGTQLPPTTAGDAVG